MHTSYRCVLRSLTLGMALLIIILTRTEMNERRDQHSTMSMDNEE